MKPLLKILFGLAMGLATYWSFTVTDAPAFQRPELARIFFFHFPCAITTSLFLFVAPYFSLRYLASRDMAWDVRSTASNELALLFGILTMATGLLFSKVQWGAWWQWDPRQTSFLLVLLILAAYFALRGAHGDAERRASNAAAYSLASALPALFLIFVFPRLPQVASFHPTDTIQGGLLKGDYRNVTVTMLVLFTVLAIWIYRIRVRAGMLELELETMNGKLETRGGPAAPTGVVRPISLSGKG